MGYPCSPVIPTTFAVSLVWMSERFHTPITAETMPRKRFGRDRSSARVSALAGANHVLVSSTLRDLVIGSGLEFEERGAHELKGVPGEWHLFAVASA